MRYSGVPDIPPVWPIVAKPSGDHIPPGGFAAANGTPPLRHGTGKPPSKARAAGRVTHFSFRPLWVRMTQFKVRNGLPGPLNEMVPPPVDNPPLLLRVA